MFCAERSAFVNADIKDVFVSYGTSPKNRSQQARHPRTCSRQTTADVEDGVGERLRGFLRQGVADAALDCPVRIRARELCGIRTRIRVRRAVGVTLERDRGHGAGRVVAERWLRSGVRW